MRILAWLPLACAAVSALFISGCVSADQSKKIELPFGEVASRDGKFAPLKDAKVEFKTLGAMHFKPGEPAELRFGLKNLSDKLLTIPEWHFTAEDNVQLYGQPWLPGMEVPDEKAWVSFNEEIAQPARHFKLDLLPGNQAVVTKKLDFVESLVVSTGAERRYFFKAELNLTSLPRSTGVFVVVVSHRQ